MRAVVLSDIHSGDAYGLADPANVPKQKPGHEFARLLFEWYIAQIQDIGPVDIVLCPGELTEGPGYKSTIEAWTTDMEEQADACVDLLTMWPCQEYRLCYSTTYHSSDQLKSDHLVVNGLKDRRKKADIKRHQRLILGGVPVDMFHRVGGSATPYGFASQLMKAGATDVVRAAYRGYPRARLYLRGHTHYYGFAGNDMLTVINCPSLKWPFGEYGNGLDRPYYTMGLMVFEFGGGVFDYESRLFRYALPEEEYAEIAGD